MSEFENRENEATQTIEGTIRMNHIIADRVTILCREHQEALTFVAENDTTYPFVRWLNAAGQFLFGLVAHEKKWIDRDQPELGKKVDKHFTMYRANEDMESRTGFFDAEFGEAEPMLKIEDTQIRYANSNPDNSQTQVVHESPDGSKWFLQVDNDGDVKAVRATGLRPDSEEETV